MLWCKRQMEGREYFLLRKQSGKAIISMFCDVIQSRNQQELQSRGQGCCWQKGKFKQLCENHAGKRMNSSVICSQEEQSWTKLCFTMLNNNTKCSNFHWGSRCQANFLESSVSTQGSSEPLFFFFSFFF